MAESNKMKDMSVNKLMIQMGIPMILYDKVRTFFVPKRKEFKKWRKATR